MTLKIWAEQLNTDGITGVNQRRDLTGEEYRDGNLNLVTFTAQQFNSLMYEITSHSNPYGLSPYLILNSVAVPDEALEANGQAITSLVYPKLAAAYGTTLPDLTGAAPAGWTFVFRKQ